jgi:hypothetical protein
MRIFKLFRTLAAIGVLFLLTLFGSYQFASAQAPPTIGYVPGFGYVISYVTRLLGPSVYVGVKGTALTSGVMEFSSSITPAATAAAIGTYTQTFTVTGLPAGAAVFVNGPSPTSLCPLVGARVSAANTIALEFSTLTAAACTPASGTYQITAIQ